MVSIAPDSDRSLSDMNSHNENELSGKRCRTKQNVTNSAHL